MSRRARRTNSFEDFLRLEQRLAQEKRAVLEAIKPPSLPPARNYSQPAAPDEFLLHWLTWKYLDSTLEFEPSANFNWRDHAAKAGEYYAKQGLDHLAQLVRRGDAEAVETLADLAITATRMLGDIVRQTPERVRPVARHRFFWPFLKAKNERFGDKHKLLVKEIELGYEAPFSEAAVARLRPTNVALRTAMTLLGQLESHRDKNPLLKEKLSEPLPERKAKPRNPGPFSAGQKTPAVALVVARSKPEWKVKARRLAPFSGGTWPAWFVAAWEKLLADHHGHPELDPQLRGIGKYRAEHSTERYSGSQAKATAKTREANIRDGVKDKLRKAIQRLANLPK